MIIKSQAEQPHATHLESINGSTSPALHERSVGLAVVDQLRGILLEGFGLQDLWRQEIDKQVMVLEEESATPLKSTRKLPQQCWIVENEDAHLGVEFCLLLAGTLHF